MGTLAFGALLVGVVQIIRVVLEYLHDKLQHAQSKPAKYTFKYVTNIA